MYLPPVFLALRSLAALAVPRAADISTVVDLGYRIVQGTTLPAGTVTQWLGIQYAAAPVGNLRFRAPQNPPRNRTLQIANQHAPSCHSSPSTSVSTTNSEDCLYLDVYAPAQSTTLHPVLVFFQGGGFNSLANMNMNGTSLIQAADLDLVVVTFNYRVGPYGFIASSEVQANGDLNTGLLDQRKLLKWVQQHIKQFGGDPNHVTIAGDSAGAASVALHLTAYGGRDDGLFHASAAESQSFGAQFTVPQAQYQYDALVARTGCSNSYDTLACLRGLPIATIADSNPNIPTPGANSTPNYMWSPVIDGKFIVDYTYNLYTEGNYVKLPAIYGDDTNEGTIFTPTYINTLDQMNSFLHDNWVRITSDQLSQIDTYYPQGAQYPNMGAYWTAAALAYGEMRYNCPGIYISTIYDQDGIAGNWNYHWDVLEPGNAASGYGVTHTAELGSIWGTATSLPESAVVPQIQGYWASFLRSKDPNTYRLAGSPEWTRFDAVDKQRFHFVNDPTQSAMESVPEDQATRCSYLSSIGPGLSQ